MSVFRQGLRSLRNRAYTELEVIVRECTSNSQSSTLAASVSQIVEKTRNELDYVEMYHMLWSRLLVHMTPYIIEGHWFL